MIARIATTSPKMTIVSGRTIRIIPLPNKLTSSVIAPTAAAPTSYSDQNDPRPVSPTAIPAPTIANPFPNSYSAIFLHLYFYVFSVFAFDGQR